MLNTDELLFYNDTIDTEIDLNSLEKLEINMSYNPDDEDEDEENEEEGEE